MHCHAFTFWTMQTSSSLWKFWVFVNNYETLHRLKKGEPVVKISLNLSEDSMQKMLDHLKQLCKIRWDLFFLFLHHDQLFSLLSGALSMVTKLLSFLLLSRMDQHTRLTFIFQKHAQLFIDVFNPRCSRMKQFLSDLEESAVQLDRMKMGATISSVVGRSFEITGGVFSIVGLALAPVTAGVSLALTVTGLSLGMTSSVATSALQVC